MRKIVWISMLLALIATPGKGYSQLGNFTVAPDFTVGDLDGNVINLYQLLDQNKVVVLDFFAVWCSNCQSTVPILEEIYAEYGPDGNGEIEMLSLEADPYSTNQQVLDYQDQFGGVNPHINDTKDVPDLYEVRFYPMFYVIAPDRSFTWVSGGDLKGQFARAIENAPSIREVENDIRVRQYLHPKGSTCLNAVWPELLIQNYGSNTIESMDVRVFVDNQLVGDHHIIQRIEPYQLHQQRFPWITDLSEGWHDFTLEITAVNGIPDGDPSNDAVIGNFKVISDPLPLVIETLTDGYPFETWWEIHENDRLIAERLDFPDAFTRHSDTVCMDQTGCYTLTVHDRFGDGFGGGEVKVLLGGELLGHVERWSFDEETTTLSFCLPGTSAVPEQLLSGGVSLFPNPASNQVTIKLQDAVRDPVLIQVFNQIGQELKRFTLVKQDYMQINTDDLNRGIYLVKVHQNGAVNINQLVVQ